MSRLYNENSKQSILEYAQQLEGKTLRDILPNDVVANMSTDELGNKGRYGQKIERYYFGYAVNSNTAADFPCGLELKATPLRVLKNGKLAPKERLVCNIINYLNIVNERWETSSFLEKNLDILLIRYIDPMDKSVSQLDYKIFNVKIHNIFGNNDDGEQFKEDWNIIVNKIKKGEAHLLSESDTTYLGACTKGSTAAKSLRQQPYSDTFAKQRAFSFKTQFMRELLNRI